MEFKDKVIWVTGASSGLGEAMTKAFLAEGAKLIISSRRVEVLEELKSSLGSHNIHVLPLDLMNVDTHEEVVKQAYELYGRIDILVNNGGVSQRSTAFDTEMSALKKIMDINFYGTVSLTKALLPYLMEQNEAHIIVTSSVMGKFAIKTRSTYCASKHALHGWFDSLRLEMEPHNISVTLVCPGFINTNISINAVTADGSSFNQMGENHEKAMTADQFAQKLLPQLRKGKHEIYIAGFRERGAMFMKRFAPGILYRVLKNSKVS